MKDGKEPGAELDLVVVERRAAASWARGATRRVRVSYGCQCGTLAGAEAVAVLNVTQDPDLAEELTAGSLNRATCPACGTDHLLRMAVTVHDPAGRRVVICAGEGDRHRALDLLVHYLEGLRDQPGDSVPAYALVPEIAFGRAAWREHLSAPPRASGQAAQAELQARKKELEDRTRAVEQRQATLSAGQRDIDTARAAIESQLRIISDRAAGVDSRDTELTKRERVLADAKARLDEMERRQRAEEGERARLREELDAERSALEDREVVLRQREEDISAAEEQLGHRGASTAGPHAAGPVAPAVAPVPAPAPTAPASSTASPAATASAAPARSAAERPRPVASSLKDLPELLEAEEAVEAEAMPVGDGDVVAERALEPDTEVSRVRGAPSKVARAAAAAPAAAGRRKPAVEPVVEVPDAELLSADGAVLEVSAEDLHEPDGGESEPGLRGVTVPRMAAAKPEPTVPEPLRTWFASGVPTFAAVEAGEVHLYRKPPSEETASVRRHLVLGCRLFVHDEVPWLEIAVADEESDPPELVDAWLVHFELVDDAAVVRVLAEKFEVQLLEVDAGGRPRWSVELSAPLARNVARMRQVAQRLGAKKKGDRVAATTVARADGGAWLDRSGRPEFTAEALPASPGAIQQMLVALTPWTTEEAEERLFTERSVPVEHVDGYRKRILGAAVKAGLWLPPDLMRRAIQDGLASSPERLVAQLTENFFRLTGRRHDLDREAAARNWMYLTGDAERLGLVIDPARRALVRALLRDIGLGETGEGPAEGPETAKGDQELLLRWLAIPATRGPALAELLRGRLSDYVPELAVALDALEAADLLESLIEVRSNEDLLADVLMAGLDAHRIPLRIASATGLGKLALRRAVVPLVHLLLRAESVEWRFVGAAIASYGATGAKAIEPMLADPRGKEDRLAWTLACFKGGAAEKHVAQLARSGEILTSAIARRAADWKNDADAFRAKLEAPGATGANAFVQLVRRMPGDDGPELLREAVAAFRAQGGMDF